jgi:hypothetical protein
MFSEAVTAELDAMGVVNDAIEDGIGQRWIAARSPVGSENSIHWIRDLRRIRT